MISHELLCQARMLMLQASMQSDAGHIPSAKAQEALKRFSSNGAGPPAVTNAAKIPFAAAGTRHNPSAADGASLQPSSDALSPQDPAQLHAGPHQSSSRTGNPQPLPAEESPAQKTPAGMSQTPSPDASTPQSPSAQTRHDLSAQRTARNAAQQQQRAEVADAVSHQEPEAGQTQQVIQLLRMGGPFVTPAGAPGFACCARCF